MSHTVELIEPPSLGRLYARAVRDQALAVTGVRSKSSRNFPGTRYRIFGLRADQRRLEAFDRLVHGEGRDEVSSGFVHIMSFPIALALMASEEFPVPLLGVVHMRNEIEQKRRISPEEKLDFTVHVQDAKRHKRGTQFDIHATATSQNASSQVTGLQDEPVWHGVSTYLAPKVFLDYPEVERKHHEFTAPDAQALWRLPSDLGRRYAEVSGDANPIHTNTLAAKALGMKTTIAHGMYLASRALSGALPAGAEAFRWSVDFAAPTYLPGTVALRFTESGSGQQWRGTEVVGWNQRSGKKNFGVSVTAR